MLGRYFRTWQVGHGCTYCLRSVQDPSTFKYLAVTLIASYHRHCQNIYKSFINRTCQWVSVVDATHILQCARAHDCIGHHWLYVNENLCLIDSVEKVVGRSPLRRNRPSPVLIHNQFFFLKMRRSPSLRARTSRGRAAVAGCDKHPAAAEKFSGNVFVRQVTWGISEQLWDWHKAGHSTSTRRA